jgi:hypothetical protein
MFTTKAGPKTISFNVAGINGAAQAILCVRLWNVLVSLLGLLVYLLGMHRSVYPYEEESAEAGAGDITAAPTH